LSYTPGTEAALLDVGVAAGSDEFGVDEHPQLVASLGNIDHDNLEMDVHLCCSQANPGSGIHRISHVFD
jgi:hypothetical protein